MLFKDYIYRFMPLAYWDIDGTTTAQSSLTGSARSLTKTSTLATYRSAIYGDTSGTRLLSTGASLTYSSSDLPLCRTGYTSKPFTILFVYSNLQNATNTSTPIFKIGNNINLYYRYGALYLDFRGMKLIYKIKSNADTYTISIHFDGSTPSMIVNGEMAASYGSMSASFEATPTFTWQYSGSRCVFSNIAVFGYNLTRQQVEAIYDVGISESNFKNFAMYKEGVILKESVKQTLLNKRYSPSTQDVTLSNLTFDGNKFSLIPKPVANINTGASHNGSSGFTFTNSGCVYFDVKPSDLPSSDIKFVVNSSNFSTATGTILEITGSNTISVRKTSASTVQVYKDDTSVYSATATGSSFELNFVNSSLTFKMSTESSAFSTIMSSIKRIYIGNNSNYLDSTLRNPYSGIISSFEINYYTYSLSTPIYQLDFNQSGYSGTIKPKQSGVANFSCYFPSGNKLGFIKYDSTGTASVKAVSIGSVSASTYYNGSAGTSYANGDPILSTTEDTLCFSVVLSDTVTSSSYWDMDNSTVSNVLLESYLESASGVTAVVNSINGPLELSSTTTNAFTVYDGLDSDRAKPYGIEFNTNNDIDIKNIPSGSRTVSFTISPGTIANPSGAVLLIGSTGSPNATLTMNYVSASSYTLTATGTSVSMYVNDTSVANGVASATLYSSDKNTVTLLLPSGGTWTTGVFRNMNNHSISQFAVFSSALSGTEITELASKAFYPNVQVNSNDTGAAVSEASPAASGRAFSARIIQSV